MKPLRSKLLLTFLTISLLGACADSRALSKAKEQAAAGQYSDAIATAQTISSDAGAYPEAEKLISSWNISLARTYAKSGDLKSAINTAGLVPQSAELAKELQDWKSRLSRQIVSSGNYPDGIAMMAEANPKSEELKTWRTRYGLQLEHQGEWAGAIEQFDKAEYKGPESRRAKRALKALGDVDSFIASENYFAAYKSLFDVSSDIDRETFNGIKKKISDAKNKPIEVDWIDLLANPEKYHGRWVTGDLVASLNDIEHRWFSCFGVGKYPSNGQWGTTNQSVKINIDYGMCQEPPAKDLMRVNAQNDPIINITGVFKYEPEMPEQTVYAYKVSVKQELRPQPQ